jgi:hypothetical protein
LYLDGDWSDPISQPAWSRAPLLESHLSMLLLISIPEDDTGTLLEATWTGDGASGGWRFKDPPSDDYVFRYAVIPAACASDGTGEYAAAHLAALLDLVDLSVDGETLVPDAVEFRGRRYPVNAIQRRAVADLGVRTHARGGLDDRQPLHSVAASEPFIVTLASLWGLISPQLRVERSTEKPAWPTAITGFRLRRTSDWTVLSGGHPSEVYEYLARVCNVSCAFCYLHGNPNGIAVARGSSVVTKTEINTRLRYYDPKLKVSLFSAQWEINEFLVDPKIYDVLPRLRRVTADPFYFITNGNPLKGRTLDLLESVKPVHLIVSVNTLDEDLRTTVMGERRSQTLTAMASLRQLVARRIPFGLSVAAFPDFSLADMERTIRLADGLQAGFVRVNLPGFTRQLPYEGSMDTNARWEEVRAFIAELRQAVSIPLITIPSAFDEGVHDDPLAPRVIGAVPGSPAARAGLRAYDEILAINDFAIATRADIFSLLLLLRGLVRLKVRRGDAVFETFVDMSDPGTCPYDGPVLCKYIFPGGIVAAPALSPRTGEEIQALADECGAVRVWVLTSPLMEKTARSFVERFVPKLGTGIRLLPVTSEFLGGNIVIMDMCTVSDIARAISRAVEDAPLPDLILLADTGFNRYGRDLEGRHWGDLERMFGTPVRVFSVTRFLY